MRAGHVPHGSHADIHAVEGVEHAGDVDACAGAYFAAYCILWAGVAVGLTNLASGICVGYYLNRTSNDRIVRAFSGGALPGSEPPLERQTSKPAEYEGSKVLRNRSSSSSDGAKSRLKRRPS